MSHRQILSICDLELRLHVHSTDLYFFAVIHSSTVVPGNYFVKYRSKIKEEFVFPAIDSL